MPKIHKLVTLYAKVETFIKIELDFSILKTLDALYIDARYPGDLGLLPDGKPTIEEAENFYNFAIEVFNIVSNYR